jgi:transcriptional regulator with XRE-family HTH domain
MPKAKKKHAGGRPTVFRDEYVHQARQFCLLGATDVQLAEMLGVSVSTVDKWKQSKHEFLQAIKDGKAAADAKVATSLFKRALGYRHKAVKILTVARGANQGSVVEEVPYVEHYPPDTAAAIFWLKNRQPEMWRDKVEQQITGANGGPLAVVMLPQLNEETA